MRCTVKARQALPGPQSEGGNRAIFPPELKKTMYLLGRAIGYIISPPKILVGCGPGPCNHIGVARGGLGVPGPPQIFITQLFCALRSGFSKQNSVVRLKSNILATPNFLTSPKFVGWLRHCLRISFPPNSSDCFETATQGIERDYDPILGYGYVRNPLILTTCHDPCDVT